MGLEFFRASHAPSENKLLLPSGAAPHRHTIHNTQWRFGTPRNSAAAIAPVEYLALGSSLHIETETGPSSFALMAGALSDREGLAVPARQLSSNRVLKSCDDIVDHCRGAGNKPVNRPWRIISIGRRDWAQGFRSTRICVTYLSPTTFAACAAPPIRTPSPMTAPAEVAVRVAAG